METDSTTLTLHHTDKNKSVEVWTLLYKPGSKKKVHPDQKYITALLNNDTALLNEVYQKFSGKIKLMILQNNGTETDAADIFQDALLCLYNKARTENFILTCPLEAFLYMICKNRWMSELSKRKSHKIKFTDTEKYENIGYDCFKQIDDCRLKQERKDLLTEKLGELNESSRELLRLSWSGKSMEEVATILGVTYGYARKKKSESMAKLIEKIKKSPKFNTLKW